MEQSSVLKESLEIARLGSSATQQLCEFQHKLQKRVRVRWGARLTRGIYVQVTITEL